MVMRKICTFGKISLMKGLTFPMGKSVMNSTRDNHFLVLGMENSISNSCRIKIHLVILPIIIHQLSIYYIGLELDRTLILHIKI